MIAELQTAIVNKPRRRELPHELTDADKVKVKVERHALLLRGAPTAICVSAVLALVMLAVGWEQVDRTVLSGWAAFIVILAMGRLALWRFYARKKNASHGLFRFTKLHIAGMAINGVAWGGLAPIFAVYGMMGHALLPFLIAGMCAATISSAGASWRAVIAFNLPALLPLGATYALTAGPEGVAIACVVGLYGLATIYLAWTTQQMIVRSIRLRSRNANLLKALTSHIDASHEAEQRYRALVESSKDVTIIFSTDGWVSYASPSVEAALGTAPSKIVGTSTKQLVHPDDFPIFKSVGERSLSNLGEVIPLAQVCFKKEGDGYVPLTGRLTNMLYVPGVEGFVFTGGLIDEALEAHRHAAE